MDTDVELGLAVKFITEGDLDSLKTWATGDHGCVKLILHERPAKRALNPEVRVEVRVEVRSAIGYALSTLNDLGDCKLGQCFNISSVWSWAIQTLQRVR